jgi:hypothetical protein
MTETPRPTDQALPIANDQPIIHRLVQADLEQRLAVGVATYGQGLQAFNGRDVLQDAYEEALDKACYLRQAMIERDAWQAEIDRLIAAGVVINAPTGSGLLRVRTDEPVPHVVVS